MRLLWVWGNSQIDRFWPKARVGIITVKPTLEKIPACKPTTAQADLDFTCPPESELHHQIDADVAKNQRINSEINMNAPAGNA